MSKFDEFLQSLVNASEDELKGLAANSLSKLLPYFGQNADSEEEGAKLLAGFIYTVVAVDGKLTKAEFELLQAIFSSFSKEELIELVDMHKNSKFADLFDELCDDMPENIKIELLNLCAAVIAYDGNINNYEYQYLVKLIK